MTTKAQLLDDAMEFLAGALNCHRARFEPDSGWIVGLVRPHVAKAREALELARLQPSPRLP